QQITYKGSLTAREILDFATINNRKLSVAYFAGDENFEKTDYTETIGLLPDGTTETVSRTAVSFYGTSRAASAEGKPLTKQITYKGSLYAAEITDFATIDNRTPNIDYLA